MVGGLSASLSASLLDDSQRSEGAEVVDIPFPPFLDLKGRQLSAIISIIVFSDESHYWRPEQYENRKDAKWEFELFTCIRPKAWGLLLKFLGLGQGPQR